MSSLLTIRYEGYWQCRQATDPDPSRDPRGASGYTFSIGDENDLDQIIRLQRDEIPDVDFRKSWPPPKYPDSHACPGEFGIFVSGVELDGHPYEPGQKYLLGGKVRWLPYADANRGPRFELRNTIIFNPGNNSGIFMPVDPFHIQVEGTAGCAGEAIRIGRNDPLNPENPEEKVWQIRDSDVYKRRCPREFYTDADEALLAIGLPTTATGTPYITYFQQRKEWLELELAQVDSKIAALRCNGANSAEIAKLEVQRGAYLNRLYVIEEFTAESVNNRLGNRLGMLARWDHNLVGNQITLEGTELLGGKILSGPQNEWRVGYWMGSFDGDTMRGYMRGHLKVPFEKDAHPK